MRAGALDNLLSEFVRTDPRLSGGIEAIPADRVADAVRFVQQRGQRASAVEVEARVRHWTAGDGTRGASERLEKLGRPVRNVPAHTIRETDTDISSTVRYSCGTEGAKISNALVLGIAELNGEQATSCKVTVTTGPITLQVTNPDGKLTRATLDGILARADTGAWRPLVREENGGYAIELLPHSGGSGPQWHSSLGGAEPFEAGFVEAPPEAAARFPAAERKALAAAMGRGLVERVTALEQAPKSETTGIWYPQDLKRERIAKGMTVSPEEMSGRAPEQFFDKLGRMGFQVKPRTSAAEALKAFLAGPTIAECGTVTLALQYAELLEHIGQERFDQLFGSAHEETFEPMRLRLDRYGIGNGNPLSYFVGFTSFAKSGDVGTPNHRPGDVGEQVYFAGVPDYGRKHPAGAGPGWNVFYCGRNEQGAQLYHGFGLKQPLTETQMRSLLVEFFNRDRTDEDLDAIAKAKTRTAFDLAANGVPEKIEDRDGATLGFMAGSGKFFDANTVLGAVHDDPVRTTQKLLRHLALAMFAGPRTRMYQG